LRSDAADDEALERSISGRGSRQDAGHGVASSLVIGGCWEPEEECIRHDKATLRLTGVCSDILMVNREGKRGGNGDTSTFTERHCAAKDTAIIDVGDMRKALRNLKTPSDFLRLGLETIFNLRDYGLTGARVRSVRKRL
jgi:hypothetical protein